MLQCRGLALLARRAGTAESALGWSRNPFLSTNLSKGAGSLLPDHAAAAAAAVACVKKNDSLRTLSSSSSKQDLLIDTLEVMRGFEQSGLKREEADVLTRHVTKLILQTSNQFSAKFASQTYLDKLSGKLGSDMVNFKSEILKTQELQLSTMQKEIEATKQELAKLRTEIRYELDKLIAGQRLDLNLEKGRLRDELQATTQSVQTIETQLHKDLNTIRTKIEENKNELIKYSIGLLVAAGSIALGMLRFLAV